MTQPICLATSYSVSGTRLRVPLAKIKLRYAIRSGISAAKGLQVAFFAVGTGAREPHRDKRHAASEQSIYTYGVERGLHHNHLGPSYLVARVVSLTRHVTPSAQDAATTGHRAATAHRTTTTNTPRAPSKVRVKPTWYSISHLVRLVVVSGTRAGGRRHQLALRRV